jgi:hypothetical protein
MQEFENVAYMDLQKTGSTTIKAVLRNVLDESFVHRGAHSGPREGYDRSKLAFISAREPLSLYISLFNFATMEKEGNLYGRLCKTGHESLYAPSVAAFERWLEFVLDPRNAAALKRDYANCAPCETIGLLSFRLLYISVPNALKKMKRDRFEEKDAIRALLGRRIWREHVRVETLGRDLFAFFARHADRLRFRAPLPAEDAFVAALPTRNVSRKIEGLVPGNVAPTLRQRVREREWLFYEAFGYD